MNSVEGACDIVGAGGEGVAWIFDGRARSGEFLNREFGELARRERTDDTSLSKAGS